MAGHHGVHACEHLVATLFIYMHAYVILCTAFAGRGGPSRGMQHEMLPGMLRYTIKSFFPAIWSLHGGDSLPEDSNAPTWQEMYLDFFKEVVNRTAALVAAWQTVGFTHGESSIRLCHAYSTNVEGACHGCSAHVGY